MLNVEKARADKIYNNEKLSPVIIALGAGIGKDFNIDKLRYHKIILMADADVDGAHIRTLLLTFFFRHMRPLVENGNIYIAQPPLFKLSKKGMEDIYCYNEADLDKKLKELITSSSNNIRTIVSCNDLLYACGGNQDMFSSVVAMAKQYLIFSHSSAISAGMWSAVLGEYERIDETVANTKDKTGQTYSVDQMYFPETRQKPRTVTTSKRRDFIIPPEIIVSMQNNEFYMKAVNFRGIRHGYITF